MFCHFTWVAETWFSNLFTGKNEIEEFQQKTSDVSLKGLSWQSIKTKVFNEKKELARKMQRLEH